MASNNTIPPAPSPGPGESPIVSGLAPSGPDASPDQPAASPTPDWLPLGQTPGLESYGPDSDRRQLGGRVAARLGIRGLLARVSRGSFRQDTAYHKPVLAGERHRDRTITDPVTAIQEVRNEGYLPGRLRIPIPETRTTQVDTPHRNGRGTEANPKHPLLAQISTSMSAGRFREAADAVRHIEDLIQGAAQTKRGLVSNLANAALPGDMKRDAYARGTYLTLMRAAYSLAMDAEPDKTVRRASPEVENEDWSAVLEPRNVQALRSYVAGRWQSSGKEAGVLRSHISTGGIVGLDPQSVAAYLGVNAEALLDQMQSGAEPVVPPMVLAKLNFLLQFTTSRTQKVEVKDADDKTRVVNVLPRELAEMDDSPLKDSTPVERMLAATTRQQTARAPRRQTGSRPDPHAERQAKDSAEQAATEEERMYEEATLSYLSGEHRSDKPDVAYTMTSVRALEQKFFSRAYVTFLKENNIDANAMRNLSDAERNELRLEAEDKAHRMAKIQLERMIELRVVAKGPTPNGDYRILMDNLQIQDLLAARSRSNSKQLGTKTAKAK